MNKLSSYAFLSLRVRNIVTILPFLFLLLATSFLPACTEHPKTPGEKQVADPALMDMHISEQLIARLSQIRSDSGKMNNSIKLRQDEEVWIFYSKNQFLPIWSTKEKWTPVADSLYYFIANAENEGLFPEDYHFRYLKILKDSLDADSLVRMNAILWTDTELLLTDAFMQLVKDLRLGRLQADSLSFKRDAVLPDDFFTTSLNTLLQKKDMSGLFHSLQPANKNYWALKNGIARFVNTMDRREYTHINFPFKRGDRTDSLNFIRQLQKRLLENNCINSIEGLPDSATLYKAIKKYQQQNGLDADGKYGRNLIRALNSNDVEKFRIIALTLDKYKQLPPDMPEKYIWVNLPGFYLRLIDADTVVFESKVICGKPETPTPLLTSQITDMITYPTWTVPNSIIVKQYLPKLKNNPNYISRLGLKLLSNKGEVLDPASIAWSKYSRGIPYKIMQGSGDNNSLGVFKFNFNNPYSVYLHDTNQRYLFKNAYRALSHGCVRVQDWQKLAFFIAQNDSIRSNRKDSLKYTVDSIKSWVAKKQMHRIDVKNRIPLFIRYFTCEAVNGKITFYEDIYGEDKALMEKYFARK